MCNGKASKTKISSENSATSLINIRILSIRYDKPKRIIDSFIHQCVVGRLIYIENGSSPEPALRYFILQFQFPFLLLRTHVGLAFV